MPEWNPDQPKDSGFLQSAELRENFQALAEVGFMPNLLGDPTHICWPKSTGGLNQQGYWQATGTGGQVSRETGAGNYKYDSMSAKLVYGSATLQLYQHALGSSADWDLTDKDYYMSGGAWLKTSTASRARIAVDDGDASTLSAYHTGGGAWEWLTVTRKISTAATRLTFAYVVGGGSATVYCDGATMIAGPIPPAGYIPCKTKIVSFSHQIYGDPVSGIQNKARWSRTKPYIVRSCSLQALSAATGAALIIDLEHWTGSAWQSMYTSGGRPRITVGNDRGYSEPNTTYRYRCFGPGGDSNVAIADCVLEYDLDQAPTSGGKDPVIVVNALEWDRPLEYAHNYNEP